MRRGAMFFLLMLLMVGAAGPAMAETYYVRTDGNNSNAGLGNSPDQAWGTIQYAANNATPGDTILIQEGVYQENVAISSAGLPSLPITYRGEGEVTVGSINFPGVSTFSGSVNYHTVIDHLRFDGSLGLSPYGIRMYGSGYVTIANCVIENYRGGNWMNAGILFVNNGWSSCYALTVKQTSLRNNDNGAAAPGSGMLANSLFEETTFSGNNVGYFTGNWGTSYVTFSRCTFEENQFGAILEGVYWYWLKTHDNTFQRCVFRNNGTGLLIGDQTASAYNGNSYANKVINSVFYGNSGAGVLIKTNFTRTNSGTPGYYDSLGQTLYNNIFMDNGTFGIDNFVNQTIFAGYNLAYQNGSGGGRNALFDVSNYSLSADPKLASPATGDFHLRIDSPCVDAGNPLYDADPVRSGEHIDIGAFELSATPAQITEGLVSDAAALPESYLKNKNNSLPLSKKLYVAMQMIIRGDEAADLIEKGNFYNSAVQKLSNDILPKTNGCATGGVPDSNDWITSCDTQAEFYGPIVDLINMLQGM